MPTILIVEDEPDLAEQLAGTMRDAGYAVDGAHNGEDGQFLGETEPYDAVILDLGLPIIDGVSVLDSFVVNVMNTPVEMVEAEFPIRIRRYELHEESGGAGKYRGGLGIRRDWEMLCEEATVNLRSDRFLHSAPGIGGGLSAKPSSAVLNPDTSSAKPQRSKVSKLLLRKGDVFSVKYGGGGGRGQPFDRPEEAVLEDVWNGYISKETARAVYGVAIENWPPQINESETRRLRGG